MPLLPSPAPPPQSKGKKERRDRGSALASFLSLLRRGLPKQVTRAHLLTSSHLVTSSLFFPVTLALSLTRRRPLPPPGPVYLSERPTRLDSRLVSSPFQAYTAGAITTFNSTSPLSSPASQAPSVDRSASASEPEPAPNVPIRIRPRRPPSPVFLESHPLLSVALLTPRRLRPAPSPLTSSLQICACTRRRDCAPLPEQPLAGQQQRCPQSQWARRILASLMYATIRFNPSLSAAKWLTCVSARTFAETPPCRFAMYVCPERARDGSTRPGPRFATRRWPHAVDRADPTSRSFFRQITTRMDSGEAVN